MLKIRPGRKNLPPKLQVALLTHSCSTLKISFYYLLAIFKNCFYILLCCFGHLPRIDEFYIGGRSVNDELGEIPRYFFGTILHRPVEFTVSPAIFENLVSVLPIYFHFLRKRELYFILFAHVLEDLCVVPRFLLHELVAGEANNFKAVFFKFFVQISQTQILHFRKSSFTIYVNDHDTFLASN